jgi:hypothetical protein
MINSSAFSNNKTLIPEDNNVFKGMFHSLVMAEQMENFCSLVFPEGRVNAFQTGGANNFLFHSYACNEYNDLVCLADNFIEMKRFPEGDFGSSLFIQLKGGLRNKENEKTFEKES